MNQTFLMVESMLKLSKLVPLLTAVSITALLAMVLVVRIGHAEPKPIDALAAGRINYSTLRDATSGHATIDGRYQEHVLAVANTIPARLQPALKGTDFINGCHPWSTKQLGDCAYGTYDPEGWDHDDTHGHQWANSIWISSQAVRAGTASDVVLHEVGHAAAHNLFSDCYFPQQAETSVKNLLMQSFAHPQADPAELLADAFVIAFNPHSRDLHTHYFDDFNFEASKEVILKIRAAVWLCSK